MADVTDRRFIFRANKRTTREHSLYCMQKRSKRHSRAIDERQTSWMRRTTRIGLTRCYFKNISASPRNFNRGKYMHDFQSGEHIVSGIATVHSGESLPQKFSLLKVEKNLIPQSKKWKIGFLSRLLFSQITGAMRCRSIYAHK